MVRLFLTYALLCCGCVEYVSCVLCISERSVNITALSLQEKFITVEAGICFVKAHYDLGSRRVFLVELYGLDEEDEPGIQVDAYGTNGIITATYSCNSDDLCNTIFLMMIELEKASYEKERELQANAILRAIRKAQADPINRDFLRQSRTPFYIVSVFVSFLIVSSFAHFASVGPTFFSRASRKKRKSH